MLTLTSATVRELDRDDIDAILVRNIIGRLAYLREGRIEVIPLNYVYKHGAIFGRTTGSKLDFLQNELTPVTFQVDEIRTGRDWRSVQIQGDFQIVSPQLGEEIWMRALGAVRRYQKHALREEDPFPERNSLFRVTIDRVTGRAMG